MADSRGRSRRGAASKTKGRSGGQAAKSRTRPQRSKQQPTERRRGGDRRQAEAAPPRRRSRFWRVVRWTLVSAIWLAVLLGGAVAYFAYDLPDTDRLAGPQSGPAVTVVAANGAVLETYGALWGEFVPVSEMSPVLPQAVVAIEDRRFYEHGGIDFLGLIRAAWHDLREGRVVEGGSTITQQLAKIAFLSPERSFKRKVQEAMLSVWLERKFTKDQILTIYLNRAYFGAGAYGVDAAAQRYFGKSARSVSLAEAAVLAGVLRAPSRLAPTRDLDAAHKRAAVVLSAMVESGFLTRSEAAAARKSPATLAAPQPGTRASRYFADWVLEQVPSFVGSGYPALTVVTTLDPALQRAAEAAVGRVIVKGAKAEGPSEAALVALSPDGAVRAMVGGADYGRSQFNRATQARRQPGSAFKLFVYLAGLEAGLRPDDVMDDAPIEIDGWTPRNYDGRFRGPVTLRQAFADSINTVAVRVGQKAGSRSVVGVARKLGIASALPHDPSLSLGTGEVSLLELTSAYGAVANNGERALPHGIVEIRNRTGEVLYRRSGSGAGRVIPSGALVEIKDLLHAVVLDGTGRAAALPSDYGPVYGKTGTSQDSRDAWFVGFAGGLVTGVWVGNDDASPMVGVSGGGPPAVLWHDFMMSALR